ncbi:baseplate assembly protein [Breoghania sp. JC706]|uniref:GPW/gp25 family protein n=1 Tax=Breoghania sp. JC706 TaxID=3117732 RepID=UPI00300BD6CD
MRTGMNAETGEVLTGWDHCVQSLAKILRTRVNTRVMRRHFGSRVPELQDANASPLTLFELYVALAEAIDDPDTGEPGYSLRSIEMAVGGRDGRFVFILEGTFYPRGHLGDFSISEDRRAAIPATGESLVLTEAA